MSGAFGGLGFGFGPFGVSGVIVSDLINLALKGAGINGVGQTASAEDLADAQTLLTMMLGQWQVNRWLVYRTGDVVKVSTGASSYTVGSGQDFDTLRPDRIEAAFVRYLNTGNPQPDFPLQVLQSREDYNRITQKTLTGSYAAPSIVFYDPVYPIGKVYFWPVPASGQFEMHLTVKPPLNVFTSSSDPVNLPDEYLEAIYQNLIVRLRQAWQLPPDPQTIRLAAASLKTLQAANAAIPALTMPPALQRTGGWNIYTGFNNP